MITSQQGPTRTVSRPASPGGNTGVVADSRVYIDPSGKRRTAAIEVPIDQFGRAASARVKCSRCKEPVWRPLGEVARAEAEGTAPWCTVHGRHMIRVGIPHAPLLPWMGILAALRPYGWPVYLLAAAAVAGLGLAQDGQVPAAAIAAGGAVFAFGVARVVSVRLTRRAEARGRLAEDPDAGKRARGLIGQRARAAGTATLAGSVWLAAAVQFGVDPHTLHARIVWTVLPVLWLPYAATYWAWIRRTRARRQTKPVPVPEQMDGGVPLDPDEAWTRYVWTTRVSGKRGDPLPDPPPDPPARSVA